MPQAISGGFCYDLHEAAPEFVDCLASWISLTHGLTCVAVFLHLIRKMLQSHKRALAGHAKNTINIASHHRAFIGVICFYILWGMSSFFEINQNYKYSSLNSPGILGKDIKLLLPLLLGSLSVRGFSNFLELYIILLLAPDNIGTQTFETAWKYAMGSTALYLPCIFIIIMWIPGKPSIYWPLENLAILYGVREALMALAHVGTYYYARNLKLEHQVNGQMRTYLSYMAAVYTGFFASRMCMLSSNYILVNIGICGDDLMRFVQFGVWGPLAYLTLKRNCQYWATDLDLEENEETLKSHTERFTWSSEAARWNCVIPKTEIYFRKTLEERMDISVELHFWRRRMTVVKRFKFDLLTRENIKLFKNEATVFRDLDHPNIVDFYGVLVDPPSLGIVMHYAKNGDLMQHLENLKKRRRENMSKSEAAEAITPVKVPTVKKDTIPASTEQMEPSTEIGGPTTPTGLDKKRKVSFLSRTLSSLRGKTTPSSAVEMQSMKKDELSPWLCAVQIAEGMQYLHENNINHCDLKSPNILLDDDFTALIADFGESRIHVEKGPSAQMLESGESRRASLGGWGDTPTGTPGWAAPECLLEKGATQASDVFSFGIILWELLTWRPPSVQVSLDDLRKDPLHKLPGVQEILIKEEGASASRPDSHRIGDKATVAVAQNVQQNPMHETANSAESKKGSDNMILVEVCDAERAHVFMCQHGMRPPIPQDAPQWLHTLLSRCWFEDPSKRPTFPEIIDVLASTMDENLLIQLPYRV